MAGLRQLAAFMLRAEWQDWERDWGPTEREGERGGCTPPPPLQALMADYGNEKDQPEDNTPFNPVTELNNADGHSCI